ncbi:MAG TPA: Trp biosynthesis-associated membrane protein [Gryllotalpicola sp.]
MTEAGAGSNGFARVVDRRRDRSLKLATIVAIIIGAGLGLTGATQDWYTVRLVASAAHSAPVVVSGSDAAPALTALSLAGLALALALAIAGRLARVIVGALGVVVGGCLIYSAVGDPAASPGVRDAVSKATGISGEASVHALIADVSSSVWPAFALVGGIVVTLGAIAALVTGRLWPGGSRRYDAAPPSALRFEDAGGQASAAPRQPAERPGDAAVSDWDELTRGQDPTEH